MRSRHLFLTIFISFLLGTFSPLAAQDRFTVKDAFPESDIEPELAPLLDEFIDLSFRAGLSLPMPVKITSMKIVSHEEMLRNMESRGNIRAVTIMEPRKGTARILLTEDLRSQPQELRIVFFHELLHAAGYDHPHRPCHWAEQGCGIMGRSPFPYIQMSREHADEVIYSSFKPRYLARLPLIGTGPSQVGSSGG